MANYFIVLSIFCVFGAIVVSAEFDKAEALVDFMSKARECKMEVKATNDDWDEMLGHKIASTHAGKCMRACIMKKYGLMDADGKFDMDAAKKHVELVTDGAEDKMQVANEIIDICGVIKVSDDACEAADEYGECMKKEAIARSLDKSKEEQ